MHKVGTKRRTRYVLAPLILLLLCLAVINLAPSWIGTPVVNLPVTQTPLTEAQSTPAAVVPVTPDPTPLPTPVPVPSPTALPTLPADATIRLLGPPAGGRFSPGEALTFYWDWPLPLNEFQQFAVYLHTEGEQELLLGVLDEPNIGSSYRLRVSVAEWEVPSGAVQWQVRLETTTNQVLAASKVRLLTITSPSQTNMNRDQASITAGTTTPTSSVP